MEVLDFVVVEAGARCVENEKREADAKRTTDEEWAKHRRGR
jgi:hypothetical protein